MSLRQRGQRASESTNEGSTAGGVYNSSPSSGGGGYGYGASPSSTAASSGGGVNNSKNANPYGGGYYGAPPTSTSSGSGGGSGGGGYNYNTSPSAVGGGGGGGGVAATNSNYGAAPTPRGYPTASAGYGGAYTTVSNNNNNNPAVTSPYASNSSSNNNMSGYSAAYNSGGYGGSPYGTTVTAGSGYGSYSISNNNNSSGAGGASAGSPNPFHTSKKKFNLGSITSNILPLLFGLVICTLTATTIHFRRSMQRTYTQIELSKQTIQKHHQLSKKRFQSNLDQLEKERASLAESNHGLEQKLKQLKVLHRELSAGHSNSIDQLNAKEAEKQSILKKIDVVKYRLEDTKEELDMYTSMVKGKAEVEEYSKKREKALWEVVGRLESRIGRESWREAEEW